MVLIIFGLSFAYEFKKIKLFLIWFGYIGGGEEYLYKYINDIAFFFSPNALNEVRFEDF